MAAEEVTGPRIVLISLNCQPFFDEVYGSLLTELESKASLQRVNEADSAIRLLSEQPQPSAALVTDEALTAAENARVWEAVLQCPTAIKPFFAKGGLKWEVGSYHRTTLVLNRDVVTNDLVTKPPPQYRQKAVFVKNSQVFAPTSANTVGETAVALASIERGKLGYVGDVNAEKGSDAVILALCGL
ncbi:triacylglycerol lipase [Lasiosphaeria ovina]|uniref:Triacylglycerol lipase n=1 Tax=Lasiosphaeria ovina TaxID=92902 RepID=A0AAE0N254_9PEZI|nr:triacylglycerol lipase [Lasiosphaeria ovina]